MAVSNQVYRTAREFGEKSIANHKGTIAFQVLCGYVKLLTMDEAQIRIMFDDKERMDLEGARHFLDKVSLDAALIKTGVSFVAPYYQAKEALADQFEAQIQKMENGTIEFSSENVMQAIYGIYEDGLRVFKMGNDMQDVFKSVDGKSIETPSEETNTETKKEETTSSILDAATQLEKTTREQTESLQAEEDARLKEISPFTLVSEKYRRLSTELLEQVKGQDQAVMEFVRGCFQGEIKVNLPGRKNPHATFLFLGPPGVGKTLLATTAAEAMKQKHMVFNMSEYADSQSQIGLVGLNKSYKDSDEGRMVKFVRENPECMLIFDEIEKAHVNVIQLFLQILDLGVVHNEYRDEDVDFSHVTIIFTSNAGSSLYKDKTSGNLSSIPKKVVMDALLKDINPNTGGPMFPAPICSRVAAGNMIMFNHLSTRHLVKMAESNFEKISESVQETFGFNVSYDQRLPLLFMYHYSGDIDARIASKQSSNFIKNELYELSRQLEKNRNLMKKVERVHFAIDFEEMDPSIKKLFMNEDTIQILVVCDEEHKEKFAVESERYNFIFASNREEAKKILETTDVSLVIVDVFCGAKGISSRGMGLEDMDSEGVKFFHSLTESGEVVPTFFVEWNSNPMSPVDHLTFMQMGAAGAVYIEEQKTAALKRQIDQITEEIYMEKQNVEFSRRGNILDFSSAQQVSEDGKIIHILFYELRKKMAVDVDSRSSLLSDTDRPDTKFEDVIGAENAKEELQYFINYLKNPKAYLMRGGKLPKGVLLYGPPGTGKTMLARAMAGESEVAFLQTSATEFKNMYVGQSEKNIRDLFARAKRYAPAIIFIDEIDAIGKERTGSSTNRHDESMLNTLLTEMDGFKVDINHPVFVLAATNFGVDKSKGGSATLDPALMRRFDNKIYVDLPNEKERKRYLEMIIAKKKVTTISEGVMDNIAERTTGQSLAIIQNVFDLAFRNATKQNRDMTDADLLEALEEYNYGEKHEWKEKYYREVAVHESGHAYVSVLSGNMPSYVTIVSRDDFGGYMQHGNQEDKPNYTKEDLIWRIRTSLAGRAAEEVFFGKEASLNTGASSDLQHATRYALNMICNYAMMEGQFVCLAPEEVLKTSMAPDYIARANELLRTEMEYTVKLIEEGRDKIETLSKALMEKNQLTGKDIEELVK